MSPVRRLIQALTVVVSAYYALWACAPAATLRPMTLDLEEPNEFGFGATVAVPGTADVTCGTLLGACGTGMNAQLWYQHRFSKRFSFGGTIFGGQTSYFGGGAQARLHWVETDRFRFGTDFEAGFLWTAVGVPLSFRLVDDLWVYTNPSVGYRVVQPARLPVGVAWGVTDTFWLQAEASYGLDVLSGTPSPRTTGFWTGSLAASTRF